jgi:hypothetical protein
LTQAARSSLTPSTRTADVPDVPAAGPKIQHERGEAMIDASELEWKAQDIIDVDNARTGGACPQCRLDRMCKTEAGWCCVVCRKFVFETRPLTPEEREYMARDADRCDPNCPYAEGIALDDAELSRWWLAAMQDYVNSNL